MRKRLILALIYFAGVSTAIPQETYPSLDSNALESERCVPKVIQRIHGRFVGMPAAQVVEVERLVKTSREGPVCIFEIGISDARNPYGSRKQVYLWEAPGPGQVFTDGHWHGSSLKFRVFVEVLHLQGLAVDQVLVRHVIIKDGSPFTHVRIFGFNPTNGYSADLLNIGAAGQIETESSGGRLSIKSTLASGQCNGCSNAISLRFDRDSQTLAIESPIPTNVALFKYLQNSARSFNN